MVLPIALFFQLVAKIAPRLKIIENITQVILTNRKFSIILTLYNNKLQLKFKKKVKPGDVLTLELEIIKEKGPIGVGKGTAKVDGALVASAELTFAIGNGE